MEKMKYTRKELKEMDASTTVDLCLEDIKRLQEENEELIKKSEELACKTKTLAARSEELAEKNEKLTEKVEELSEQLQMLLTKQFGRKTEKQSHDSEQLVMNEVEALFNEETEEPEAEQVVPSYRRRVNKTKGKRDADLSNMPVRVEEHTIPEEKLEELFEEGYTRLPDQIYKKVDYIPAKFEVVEHHIAVYKGKKEGTIVKAKHPVEMLEKSIATASLAAGIMNAKYINAMPLNRVEKEFERYDLKIPRQVMAGWMIKLTERYLSLIYDRAKEKLFENHVIHADETPVKVNKDGRKAGSKSYMWVYKSGDKKHPVILYDYCKTRNTEHLKEFLENYKGVIVSDGYASYHKLERERAGEIKVAGCWVHCRRRFADIIKSSSGSEKKKQKYKLAEYGLAQITDIYHKDGLLKDLEPKERLRERELTIAPLVETFFAWVAEHRPEVTKGSAIGKAFDYALNQKEYLMAFLSDPEIPLDNNAAELSIRPFCVGRNNWKVIDTVHGAKSSAMLYSIAEMAKANNLKPYTYFKYLLEEIPKHMDGSDLGFIDNLMPWSEALPAECRKEERNEEKDDAE